MTAPVIEAGDITSSSGTSQSSMAVDHPAYVSGDLLIQWYGGDDNLATASLTTPSSGGNSETLILDSTGDNGAAAGPCAGVIAWVGDATVNAGSLTWTRGSGKTWGGRTIKVLAGEFDATTEFSALSPYDGGVFGSDTTIPTPTWTISSSDGGGTVVVLLVTDTDPISGTPTGWGASLENTDHGACAVAVAIRDAATTNSETIDSVNYTISPGDTSTTIGVVVRGSAATTTLPDFHAAGRGIMRGVARGIG